MDALFLLFVSLVSIECISGKFSPNVEETSTDTLNSVNQISEKDIQNEINKIKRVEEYHILILLCFIDEECIIDCPVSSPKNESNIIIDFSSASHLSIQYYGQRLNFTFKNTAKRDPKQYQCQIMSEGTETEEYFIRVYVYENREKVPIIIRGPENQYAVAGRLRTYHHIVGEFDELAHFRCVTYNATVINVTWLHDGKIIEPSYNFRMSGEYLFILVSNITEDFFGNYTCLVNSPRGTNCGSAFLFTDEAVTEAYFANVGQDPTVMYDNNNYSAAQSKPFFISAKRPNVTVMVLPASQSLDLICPAGVTATGTPTPNITWLKDGKESEPEFGMVKYSDWSMSIDLRIPRDSGNYTCIVCNELGCINSTYDVRIINDDGEHYERPSIKEGYPENITASIGTSASLSCPVVNDYLDIYTRWFQSTCVEIEHSDVENMVHNAPSKAELARITTKHLGDQHKDGNFSIANLTKEDDGWYSCLVSSESGEVCKSAYLKVDNDTQPANPGDKIPNEIVWAGLAVILSIAGVIIIIFVLLYRYMKKEKKKRKAVEEASRGLLKQWTKKIIVEKKPSTGFNNDIPDVRIEMRRASNVSSDSADVPEFELPVDTDWEFSREQLTLGNNLGEGNFGRVVKAEAHSIVQENVTTTVAVKMLKERHSDSDMVNLVKEMEVLKMIGKHDNVLNLLGCCTKRGDLLVIVPFAPHGSLKEFFAKYKQASGYGVRDDDKSLSEYKLVSFAHQISKGMEYLASKRFIHRDLAARNILVAEDFVMKIADFGLARDIYSDDYYRKITNGKLPVKWMAPEALFERKFTTKSDVWSYGVLLWEIMTLGGIPYPSVPNAELFDALKSGYRMGKPSHCSIEMYSIMRDCWSYRPNDRPTFSQLVEKMEHILAQPTSNEYCMENPFYISTTPPSQEYCMENPFYISTTPASQEYYIENPIYISATPPYRVESSNTEDQTHDKEYCIENPVYQSTTPPSQEYCIENPIYEPAYPPSSLEPSDIEDQTHNKEYCIENPIYIPATSLSSLQLSDVEDLSQTHDKR